MATLARSAPLPEKSALVEDPQFQEILQRSRSLIRKILLSVPDTHKSCIHSPTLQLNSSENSKLEMIRSEIGIPDAPVFIALSENFNLETGLTRMSECLQLHWALLNDISPRLSNKNKVTELMADIRDLTIQINKMLKIVHTESVVQFNPTPTALKVEGEYEVQVAVHLILVQLLSFGQDMERFTRSLDLSKDKELDS